MSATIIDFIAYQQKAQQQRAIIAAGWKADSFQYDDNKELLIYLIDRHEDCMQFFSCDFVDICDIPVKRDLRQRTFIQGWECIVNPERHSDDNNKDQRLMFRIAKRVISGLSQWQNLTQQQMKNQLARHSHLLLLIDSKSAEKPLDMVLLHTQQELLQPWKIDLLLRRHKLRNLVKVPSASQFSATLSLPSQQEKPQ